MRTDRHSDSLRGGDVDRLAAVADLGRSGLIVPRSAVAAPAPAGRRLEEQLAHAGPRPAVTTADIGRSSRGR